MCAGMGRAAARKNSIHICQLGRLQGRPTGCCHALDGPRAQCGRAGDWVRVDVDRVRAFTPLGHQRRAFPPRGIRPSVAPTPQSKPVTACRPHPSAPAASSCQLPAASIAPPALCHQLVPTAAAAAAAAALTPTPAPGPAAAAAAVAAGPTGLGRPAAAAATSM